MTGAISALYEPLLERDHDGIEEAVRAFRQEHSSEELFLAITRFAVLAYAPAQHAKHALLACLAAYDLRETIGEELDDLLIECACYVADSRMPWSEPPILEPPPVEGPVELSDLRAAMEEGDRLRAERWLAANLETAERDLLEVARGTDAFLLVHAAMRLAGILGDRGRYVVYRVAVWEVVANHEPAGVPDDLETLLARVTEEQGSIESVHDVFLWLAEHWDASSDASSGDTVLPPSYSLGRDYAHTLIAHSLAPRIANAQILLAAVRENLENGPDFEEWSFA
jgi:hypothetical protein